MAFLEAKNIHKVYTSETQPLEILKGVHLEIPKGASIAIQGASGAGKSTLLHILGTLDSPSSGELLFDGENVLKRSEKKLAKFRNRTIGFVFQFHHLLPMLDALENTMLPMLIHGDGKHEAAAQAKQLLERMGLEKRLHHRPSELSGGEQQRVAIARALVMTPKILMADEPTGNLDSRTGGEIVDLLLELRERYQMTLAVVTHNDELAARFGSRVFLKDGALIPG